MGELQRRQHQERRGHAPQLGPVAQHGRLESATGGQRHRQEGRADESRDRATHLGGEGRQGEARGPGQGRDQAHRQHGGEHQERGEGHPGQGGLSQVGAHAPRRAQQPTEYRAGARSGPVQAREGGARDRGRHPTTAGASERISQEAEGPGPREAHSGQRHRDEGEHGAHRRGREPARHSQVDQDQPVLRSSMFCLSIFILYIFDISLWSLHRRTINKYFVSSFNILIFLQILIKFMKFNNNFFFVLILLLDCKIMIQY